LEAGIHTCVNQLELTRWAVLLESSSALKQLGNLIQRDAENRFELRLWVLFKMKRPNTPKTPTRAQQAVLENLVAGRQAWVGLRGQSSFGGLQNTLMSMRRREWLNDDNELMDAGREACLRGRARK
jgi:hypothetical protein